MYIKILIKFPPLSETNISMNSKFLAFMNQFSKNMGDPQPILPLNNEDDIRAIDTSIKEAPLKYVRII